jgi:hypothetical protein
MVARVGFAAAHDDIGVDILFEIEAPFEIGWREIFPSYALPPYQPGTGKNLLESQKTIASVGNSRNLTIAN